MPQSARVVHAVVAAGLFALGCGNAPAPAGLNTGEAVALTGVKVDLPPPPPFADLDQPQTNPDGTMTVFGLRKGIDKYLGKETKVKAFLLDVYVCPPCPKKQTCKLCEQPNFLLGDKADTKKEKGMLVVDYLAPKEKPPFLTVGQQYVIEGTFARNSPGGFAASDGLLLFGKMTDDKGKEFIAPSAIQEAKMLAGEAAESGQMEKAARLKAAALRK